MIYTLPQISKIKNGRRIAIGDIHGCLKTFQKLLEKIDLTHDDQLFLLGDLIDKGQSSRGVVDYVMTLIESTYQVYTVRGNHEQGFLIAYDCGYDFLTDYLKKNNVDGFLDDEIYQYLEFFDNLEYGYELDDFIISHTEFLIDEVSLYRGMRGLFSQVQFQIDNHTIRQKTQIIGHSVKTLTDIQNLIQQKSNVLYIDNGCVYKNNEGLGHLIGLDIDLNELYIQRNVD
jgi:serine/threonine protein phosphatase 1